MKKALGLLLFVPILLGSLLILSGCGLENFYKQFYHKCENFEYGETEPTCTRDGYTYMQCVECYAVTPIAYENAFGHSPEITKQGFAPSCTTEGLSDEIACTVCMNIIEAQRVIEPTGHRETVEVEGYGPRCNVEGKTDLIVCSVCDATISEAKAIEALVHKDDDRNAYCDHCDCHYSKIAKPIGNVEELKNIIQDMNGIYVLTSDISLQNTEWFALGNANLPFTGYFFGNGHSISGMTVSNAGIGGLFSHNSGVIDGVIIRNLYILVSDANINAGGLVAHNKGTITNCSLIGRNTLSFSGYEYKTTKWPSYSGDSIAYSGVFGGLVSKNEGSIVNCSANGSFLCTYDNTCRFELIHNKLFYLCAGEEHVLSLTFYFGLIAGQNSGEINNCSATMENIHTINVVATKINKYGLAVANAYAYIGSITGLNSGRIISCTANKATVSQNVGFSDIKESAGSPYGEKCHLSLNEDPVYKGLIGKNQGTVEGVASSD